jgi:hypothetical protein
MESPINPQKEAPVVAVGTPGGVPASYFPGYSEPSSTTQEIQQPQYTVHVQTTLSNTEFPAAAPSAERQATHRGPIFSSCCGCVELRTGAIVISSVAMVSRVSTEANLSSDDLYAPTATCKQGIIAHNLRLSRLSIYWDLPWI